jgi:hypothetical protein
LGHGVIVQPFWEHPTLRLPSFGFTAQAHGFTAQAQIVPTLTASTEDSYPRGAERRMALQPSVRSIGGVRITWSLTL